MASEEQIVLSEFIKNVHNNLRTKSKEIGVEKAWEEHCNDENTLLEYAFAMKELAVNHWERKLDKFSSRIIWTRDTCLEYFRKNLPSIREKEKTIGAKVNEEIPIKFYINTSEKWKLLDVGSCYNAYKHYDFFDVIAIDIAPASEEVLKCDFLNVKVDNNTIIENNHLKQLSKEYFDVIVFSLLLEYLPNSQQRRSCCEKAYNLLKTEGILIIISPDSNHVGTNAKLIKSWRFVLARMGFSRIKYEKLPHIHCMAFRKSLSYKIPSRWAGLYEKDNIYDEIFIPQDFKDVSIKVTCVEELNEEINLIEELPFHCP